jgi:hypothetical protein
MKKGYLLVAFGSLLTLPVSSAQGQACIGLASLATRPMNLLVSAEFTDGAKAFTGRFGFGSSIAFGGIRGSIVDYDDIDGTAKVIGADGGLSFITGAQRNISFCPIVGLSYTNYPDIEILGNSYGSSSTDGEAGIALGATLDAGTMSLIPFGSLRGVYSRFDVDVPNSDSESDTYGILSAGLSFVLSDAFLIRPIINIPLGLEGSDPSYGVGVSIGFGSR